MAWPVPMTGRACGVQPSGGGAKAEAKKATGVPLLKIHWDAISPDKVTALTAMTSIALPDLKQDASSLGGERGSTSPFTCTSTHEQSNAVAGSMQAPD